MTTNINEGLNLKVKNTPTGNTLTCKGWVQEAALRMLLNNLDPEVAERVLVVAPAQQIDGRLFKLSRGWCGFWLGLRLQGNLPYHYLFHRDRLYQPALMQKIR